MCSENLSLLKDKIRKKLYSYIENMTSRTELVEWIRKTSILIDKNFNDPILEAVFNVIHSSTVKENSFNEHGEPYFIRDYDLYEWLMSLENKDADSSTTSDLVQLRPHQVVNLYIDQLIAFNAEPVDISSKLGIEHLRGLDELDFFQEFSFQLSTKVQFRFVRHMRSQEPNAFVLYSNKKFPVIEINRILDKLNLSISDALWINPEIQDKLTK